MDDIVLPGSLQPEPSELSAMANDDEEQETSTLTRCVRLIVHPHVDVRCKSLEKWCLLQDEHYTITCPEDAMLGSYSTTALTRRVLVTRTPQYGNVDELVGWWVSMAR